ncbi:MAG TPA: carbohydrate-binding protein [Candidatus Angelobacter sp.]|nr:carbohydrate-binding protein [Candidatus Angelobacter sp.]
MKSVFLKSIFFVLLMISPLAEAQVFIPWQSNTAYAVGARVGFGTAAFVAIQAHRSEANWQPPNTPALWQPIPLPTETIAVCGGVSRPIPRWNSVTPYGAGSLVNSSEVGVEGGVFQAITANQGVEPGTDPNVWAFIVEECPTPTPTPIPPPQPLWAPDTAYSAGQQVIFVDVAGPLADPIEFTAVQAHTSESNWQPPNVPALWQPTIPTPEGFHVVDTTSHWVLFGWNPVMVGSNPPFIPSGYVVINGQGEPFREARVSGIGSSSLLLLLGDQPDAQLRFNIATEERVNLFPLLPFFVQSLQSALVAVQTPPESPCSGPPSAPSGLTVTRTGTDSVVLEWNASSNASPGICSIKGYQIRDNSILSNTTGTGASFTIGGLQVDATHQFTVSAYNEFGLSAPSSSASFTLSAP